LYAQSPMRIAPEVAEAVAGGRPVVALESTLISHGLPRPRNLDVARELEATVREAGATPATIAVVAGEARVGLDDTGLEAVAAGEGVVKCGVRDLAVVAARGGDGATTVAATAHLAARAGISVFATGGLGGVHRESRETWDESADLETLAHVGIAVVCSGVKSILDVGATLERLETLGVTVLGYGTDGFAGFYLHDSGYPAPWRVDTPAEVAAVLAARHQLGTDDRAVVVANPLPVEEQLDPELHDRVLAAGLAAASAAGASGKDITPFLLDFFHRETAGASLAANVRLVIRNAELGARIAVAATAA
jgi:pseudouridylate synthase